MDSKLQFTITLCLEGFCKYEKYKYDLFLVCTSSLKKRYFFGMKKSTKKKNNNNPHLSSWTAMRAAVRGSLYSLLLLPEIHRLITCGLSQKGTSYHW